MIEGKELKKARVRVGWFVILGITLVIFLLLVMSVRTDLFVKKISLYVAPTSATSFYIGQAVKLHGYRVGSVQHITLQKSGAVKVKLRIMEKYHAMLNPSVKVRSMKEGLIGELILELIPGTRTGQPLLADTTIPYEAEETIEKFLQDIKPAVQNADTLLKEMAALSIWLNDPYGDVRIGIQHIRMFSERLKNIEIEPFTKELTLVTHQLQLLSTQLVDTQSVLHLNKVLRQAENNLKRLAPLTNELEKKGPQLIDESLKIVNNLDTLIQTLNRISMDVEAASPQLPRLVSDSAQAIHDMKNMAQSLRTSWLFSDDKETLPTSTHTDPILDFRP